MPEKKYCYTALIIDYGSGKIVAMSAFGTRSKSGVRESAIEWCKKKIAELESKDKELDLYYKVTKVDFD